MQREARGRGVKPLPVYPPSAYATKLSAHNPKPNKQDNLGNNSKAKKGHQRSPKNISNSSLTSDCSPEGRTRHTQADT